MRHFDELISRGMAVIAYKFQWVYAFVTCGCITSDDNPLLKFSQKKGVGAFTNGNIYIYNDMRSLTNHV